MATAHRHSVRYQKNAVNHTKAEEVSVDTSSNSESNAHEYFKRCRCAQSYTHLNITTFDAAAEFGARLLRWRSAGVPQKTKFRVVPTATGDFLLLPSVYQAEATTKRASERQPL